MVSVSYTHLDVYKRQLLFLTVLNSRFRLLAEAIVSGGVFVLSIVLNLLLSPAFNDATGQFGNGMNVLLLLVAAVFLYTNNLAQKLSLSCLLYTSLFAFFVKFYGFIRRTQGCGRALRAFRGVL